MTRVLVVEDSDLAIGLRANLEVEGYEVEVARDGRQGLALARDWEPDLLVLDLMLPHVDGLQVLGALRKEGHDFPVLLLTARGEEADKVVGLKLGADDYVTKPFGLLDGQGAVVPRRDLLRRVWGYRAAVATRTLDTHVAELRRKLEADAEAPRHILTVRKVGYRLAP